MLQLKHRLLFSATGYLGEFNDPCYAIGQFSASITAGKVAFFFFFFNSMLDDVAAEQTDFQAHTSSSRSHIN